MTDTAVGLFDHSAIASSVVDLLRASGFSNENIRTLTQPLGMAVDSATSTPGVDFEAALLESLHSMGASDAESQHYVDGVRKGKALVFATGSAAQASNAISIMDSNGAVEVEEFAGAVAPLPTGVSGELAASKQVTKTRSEDRAKNEGAKVFSW